MSVKTDRVSSILAGLLFLCVAGISQTTISFSIEQDSLLTANAGNDHIVRAGTDLTIGSDPTAHGGREPFQYEWMKGDSVISTQANPVIQIESDVIYSLKVTDSQGCTSQDSVNIALDVTGYDSFTEDGIKIYPNPAKDWFAMETGGKACMITLIAPDGSVCWTKELSGTGSFKTPDIPGIYLIKVEDKKEVKVAKIIFE